MSWDGGQIKVLLKEKNITQADLASRIGVSRQALIEWTKEQIPKGGHLLKLCQELGVSPDIFFKSDVSSRIAVPMHRTRRTAKLNTDMQQEAFDIASNYELFFREALEPGLVQSLRISKKTEAEAIRASKSLRKMTNLNDDVPLNFSKVFELTYKLGINLIFTEFHPKIKAYAFYTKINGHRVVFVDFNTSIIDLIFAILHENIHSIRDESNVYENSCIYEKEEEDFCDKVASYVQLTEGYIEEIVDILTGLSKSNQIARLKKIAQRNNYSLHAIYKRVRKYWPNFDLNIYPADTNIRKKSPNAKKYFFNTKDHRTYLKTWIDISPLFINNLIEQSERLSSRRISELLSLESELDARELKKELIRFKKEN